MQQVEYVIRKEGNFKRVFEDIPISLNDGLAEAFASGAIRGCNKVVDLGGNYGVAGMTCAANQFSTWSVRVRKLPLNTNFALDAGVLYPTFGMDQQPLMNLSWSPPDDMCLILAVCITGESRGYRSYEHYLVALDNNGRHWKLPLSNLHTNLKLCSGLIPSHHATALDALREATNQFDRSQWNSDLYRDLNASFRNNTRQLFRFKPVDTGVEQLPSVGHWTALSEKIGNEKIAQSIVQVTP